MKTETICIQRTDVQKLLGAANPDAALLYIFLQSGNALQEASQQLKLSEPRLACAVATLRQLGLVEEEKKTFLQPGEKPSYSEEDVLSSMQQDASFRSLYGEVQRRLGRTLTTEELKVLLGLVRYLGLPEDVICVLITYCQERARQRGNLRNPALRTIEKEAYAWAERGIDTLEAAAAFIQDQNAYFSRLSHLMRLLQIRGRSLTAAEEKYAAQWLQMGFEDGVIAMAYERTCLNTGGLNWAYMHKILSRWKESGFRTAEEIRRGDRKPSAAAKSGQRQLDEDEIAAIQRMMQEG